MSYLAPGYRSLTAVIVLLGSQSFSDTSRAAAHATVSSPSDERGAALIPEALRRLRSVSRDVPDVTILDDPRIGISGVGGEAFLGISASAVAGARGRSEVEMVLATALAYRAAARAGGYVGPVARAASAIIGGYVTDAVEERDRQDPYLKLPTPPPALGDFPRKRPRDDVPRPALVAMAAMQRLGTCPRDYVEWLGRLRDAGVNGHATASSEEAKAAIHDLGMLAFSPGGRCSKTGGEPLAGRASADGVADARSEPRSAER